jgi:Bacterial Ig-like domain (group 2)
MQVITAPLIAVTAYYIFRPAAPLESVLLGFASGFASEPILVMIRALVDKLRPAMQASQPSTISVTVTPSSATVSAKKTQQFTAKVSGSTNSDVTWVIDPSDGSAGIISQSGLYVAPDSPPTKAVIITARSVADSTKSASASVKVEPAAAVPAQPSAINVTVTPSPAIVPVKKTQQFTANVSGSTNKDVTWLIDPSDGSAGTISQSGLYTAPDSPPAKAVTITAKSVADPTKSGTATVKVEPA